jgi:hypothetical protein
MNTRYFVSTHDEGRTAPTAIDIVRDDGRSLINGETQAEIELRFPNVCIMTCDEFQVLQERSCVSAPVVITSEKFEEMLCCLSPMKWRSGGGAESFMMSEFMTGRITGIYCRIGTVFFSFFGICSLTHDEIVAKCMATRDALNLCTVSPTL